MKTSSTMLGMLISIAVIAVNGTSAYADTLNVADDSYIDLNTNDNFGSDPHLSVQNTEFKGQGGENHAFLRFDLSLLTPGETSLRLWIDKVTQPGAIEIYPVLGAWNEDTITGGNAPLIGDLNTSVVVSSADEGHFVTVDLTSLANKWLDSTLDNYGIALVPAETGVNIQLDSKENPQTSHEPELEVVANQNEDTGVAVKVIQGNSVQVPCKAVDSTNYIRIASVMCPTGWTVLGGGYFINRLPEPILDVYISRPLVTSNEPPTSGWQVGLVNLQQCPGSNVNAYVVCAQGTVEFIP